MTAAHVGRQIAQCGSAAAVFAALAFPGSAAAAPSETPHGAGVCISQLAIEPQLVGATNFGALASSMGSGMPAGINSLRGDGPGGCGAPPGPGHLS